MQSDLAQAGITMNIQNLAGDAYIQDWLKGKFQAAFAWNGADPDPYTMYGRYFGTGANLGVPAGYSSPSSRSCWPRATPPQPAPARRAIWTQFSNALTSNAVWIWLFTAYDYAAVASIGPRLHLAPTNSTSLGSLRSTSLS